MMRGNQQTPNLSPTSKSMKINANLANTIYRHSLNTPDAPAVVCRGQTLTYREFAGKAAQIAASSAPQRKLARPGRQPTPRRHSGLARH
jgi:acyl-CoA synthetase (AMP-forming)/AMP-acid ligase II